MSKETMYKVTFCISLFVDTDDEYEAEDLAWADFIANPPRYKDFASVVEVVE